MSGKIRAKVDENFRKYTKRTYGKGQILIYADEAVDHIYYLTKGSVRQYDITYRGEEMVLNLFRPPAFFPMSNVINKSPSKFFYRTETEVILHQVPADDALEFVQNNPDVVFDLLGRVYTGADVLLERMSQLMAGNARSRLVFELSNEARWMGAGKEVKDLKLKINEQDLAARTGMSRETVSRELKYLKDNEIIDVKHSGITLLSHAKLLELSDPA